MELSPKVTGNLEKVSKRRSRQGYFLHSMHQERHYKIETHYKMLILYGKIEGWSFGKSIELKEIEAIFQLYN